MKSTIFIGLAIILFSVCDLLGQPQASTQLNAQADSLVNHAKAVNEQGKVLKAVSIIEETLKLYEQTGNWPAYVLSCLEASDFLSVTSNLAGSFGYVNRAINEGSTKLSNAHPYLIKALWKKGELYVSQWVADEKYDDFEKLDSAKMVLSNAIKSGQENKIWEELCWAFIIRAVVDYYQNDFQSMEHHTDQAFIIAKKEIISAQDHFTTISQLQSILYNATGDYEKAYIASREALEGQLGSESIDSFHLSNAYNNHGSILYERGDYDQAIHHYIIALSLFKKIKSGSNQLITTNNNICLAYRKKLKWEEAIVYLEQSKDLLPPLPDNSNFPEWIQTYQLLAASYIDQNNLDLAASLLDIILRQSKIYSFHQEWVYSSYGRAQLALGEPKKARSYFEKALGIFSTQYGSNHPWVAQHLRHIGRTYLAQNHLMPALNYLQKSLLALAPGFDDSIYFSNPSLDSVIALTEFLPSLGEKAKVLSILAEQDLKWEQPALKTYRLAVSTIDRMRQDYETEEAKLLLSTSAKRVYEGSIKLLYQLYSKNKDPELLAEAFQYAEKSKSLLLLEMIRSSEARQKLVNPLYAGDTLFYQLLDRGKSIKTEILFYEQKLAEAQQAKAALKIKTAESTLAKLYEENLNWKAKIRESYPAYYDLQYDQSFADIETIRETLLTKNDAFLEYFIGEASAFLFVISRQETQFLRLPDASELEPVNKNFLKALLNPEGLRTDAKLTFSNYNRAAYQLYQSILAPALTNLPAVENLIIVPDAFLNNLPFEALTDHGQVEPSTNFARLPYLLNRYRIHYGYSANLLLANRQRQVEILPNTDCFALAPPYKGSKQIALRGNMQALRSTDTPLEGTVKEIREIANHFSGLFDFSASATEAFFKLEAPNYGILHLAMHGIADFENPDFAHLKFTNLATDTIEDNLLHHHEIADLKLNAQLAVLSACETGIGKYAVGEGVFSLARSFMYAGVPSVVMSLWKISDQSTGQLMPIFYEKLAKGLNKDAALQSAKQQYLQSADLEYRHPFYWSGMVLLGDEQALKRGKSKLIWWLGGSLLVLAVLYFSIKRI